MGSIARLGMAGFTAAGVAAVLLAFLAPAGAQTIVPRTHGPVSAVQVAYSGAEKPGTIVVDAGNRKLLLVETAGKARQYSIAVGREGFGWKGTVRVGGKREWPEWIPPQEMRLRDPDLPESVPPGPLNPLGARAIYLFDGKRDTLYRIHGTNDASSVGGFETSGCFRLSNADVMDLFKRVSMGAKVIVDD
jgi:lipoprotein-anchoring transpeptidase ErfK/SrfK